MMPAENQNVVLPAGDSLEIVLPVKTEAGVDVPLAGATVRWWMGRSKSSIGSDVFLKKSIGSGIVIAGATATVSIAPADTDAIPAGVYYHEAEVVFADATVSTVTTGSFTIGATIVR
jgi:hypothetical protein